MSKTTNTANKTDYLGGIEYDANALKRISFSVGYAELLPNATYEYKYAITDHLGNTRSLFSQDATTLQRNHYYAFGLSITSLDFSGAGAAWKYQYNGKEKQTDFGLNWLDYGARQYDPLLARWHSVDPAADLMRRYSPYNYSFDNPIRFLDPDGMVPGDFHDENGKYLGTDGKDDGKLYVVTDRKEAKRISSATENGQTTSKETVASALELPSYSQRSQMGAAVDRSNAPNAAVGDLKGGFHEEGGALGTNTESGAPIVVDAKPGQYADPLKETHAQVDVLSGDLSNANLPLDGTFHVHPSGTATDAAEKNVTGTGASSSISTSSPGSATFGGREPSDLDYAAAKGQEARGMVKPNAQHYILAPQSNSVTIYNSSGKLARFPLNSFRTLKPK